MTLDIFFAIICAVFSIVVVVSSNPIVSAFSLLTMFLAMGGIFYQLGSTFLSAVQVLVYAGAISILFIFVLMLLNLEDIKKYSSKAQLRPILGIICSLVVLGVFSILITNNIDYLNKDLVPKAEMSALFKELFEKYMVPFELATMLLLAAVVAVVCMLKKSFNEKNLESK